MNAPVSFVLDSPSPVRNRVSPVLWTVGFLAAIFLFWADLANWKDGLVAGYCFWGRDFVNVWTGGHLVRAGDLESLYDISRYQAYQQTLFPGLAPHNYSYPPVSFPLAALLSLLPYPIALATWLGGTGALFVQACRRWWPAEAGWRWLVLLTPAALLNIWAGHYGFLLGALFLFGWQKLETSPRTAGVLFGCMLIKPHLALMVGVALLVRREWTAIAAGIATVAGLVAATSLLFGWQMWLQFVFDVGPVQSSMIDAKDNLFGLMSTSVSTAMLRLTRDMTLVTAVQAVMSLGAVALVAAAAARRVPVRDLALLSATCTFLALPYAFNYDMTVVALGALVAMVRGRSMAEFVLAGLAFLAPSYGMLLGYFGVPLIPLALAGLAWTQWRQATAPAERHAFNLQTAAAG